MKGLSLTQPWASLVAFGEKRVETRSWPAGWRGPLAIHAAKKWPRECVELCFEEPFRSVLKEHIGKLKELPTGAIVATARLADCVQFTEQSLALRLGDEARYERQFGDYALRRYGFLLTDVVPLAEPIACRGALGLWDVPADIISQIAPSQPNLI